MDFSNVLHGGMIVHGVALAPLVSMIISILKQWVKLEKQWIPLLNVLLGAAAVLAYSIVEGGIGFDEAVITTMTIVFGSSLFHETFGHAGKALREAFPRED